MADDDVSILERLLDEFGTKVEETREKNEAMSLSGLDDLTGEIRTELSDLKPESPNIDFEVSTEDWVGAISISVDTSKKKPESPEDGDLWLDPEGQLRVFRKVSGGKWMPTTPT